MDREIKNDNMATRKLVEYVITCRKNNTDEWMQGLVTHVNQWAEAVQEEDRVASLRDGLQVVTPRDVEETYLPLGSFNVQNRRENQFQPTPKPDCI